MKAERYFDSQGRITIPSDLLALACIEKGSRIAICLCEPNCVLIKSLNDILDCKILATAKLDSKNRFIMPTNLRSNNGVLVYVFDGDIYLKEVHC